MKKNIYILLMVLILALSFGVRLWRVDKSPDSVNWDEAALGYNAYSLLKTGRDEFGKVLPVSLRSFDDYKPALYSYLSVPPVALFGLSETSTRLTSVISGVILVFLALYLTVKLTGSFKTGLAAAVFLSLSPWAMHFSRIAFEANLASSLYYLGIGAFILGLKEKRFFYASFILMIISMYAYHAQRAVALPTFVLLWILFRPVRLNRAELTKLGLILGLGLLPLIVSFVTEPAGSRLTATNVLKLWPFVPKEFSQIVYSPIYTMIWQLAGQFMAYFSPASLFVRGSVEPILRIPTLGLFGYELLPLLITGLLVFFKSKQFLKVAIAVLLLAPLPGVVTWNWFSVVRTVAVYPMLTMIMAIGASYLVGLLKPYKMIKAAVIVAFCGIFAISSWYTFLTVTIFAPWDNFGDFQPGFEQSVPTIISLSQNKEKVIFDSPHIAPYIFVLFYSRYSPQQYLDEAGLNRKNSGTEDYAFGKFTFRKISQEDWKIKNAILVGPTARIPDYAAEQMQRDGAKVVDFFDVKGYTSFRVVDL
ncbi:hypothetical protein A2397_04110 [Candidatus Amesbacteria bacterium RIFOXYB1_FULL_44_23]|uniref:Glycosyltransferase RgtA/B/C/D-like domain-containing protein n=1 Tax=Candidatus Amesbacteria bacterium RIFOXYB1_FULL_44_23 TaxID=1797263 RepID=A0A1F4ZQU8_9BACT|nr:MAG: hypothetical protein A2397_04110 [Candidatus Amesbacteria bacterium RIFOXYB1_FULL_44_23]